MSRSGSRYPSAYGHTPSYRSYLGSSAVDTTPRYPSALDTGLGSSGLGSSSLGLGSSSLGSSMGLGSTLGTALGRTTALDMLPASDLGLGSGSSKMASSSYSYSAEKQSSSSLGGGRPVVEYSSDSTYKASKTGPSGIPHTSYAHSSSNYNSEEPWRNRASNYSYNI